jgi:hypothetical protein
LTYIARVKKRDNSWRSAALSPFGIYIINYSKGLKKYRFCIFLSFSRLIWPTEKWTKINVQKKVAQKSLEKKK